MSNGETQPTKEPRPWLTPRSMRVTLGLYLIVLLLYGLTVWRTMGSNDAGLLGDMFGAFNAFVSGLAMLGVVAAIFLQKNQIEMQAEELRLQRNELALQRHELELTREELGRSASAQQEQAHLMHKASHLNALSTMVESYTTFLTRGQNAPGATNTRADLGELLKALSYEIDARSPPTDSGVNQ